MSYNSSEGDIKSSPWGYSLKKKTKQKTKRKDRNR